MDSEQLLANLLPFLMSYAIQFLKNPKPLAENMAKALCPKDRVINGFPFDFAINLAIHFYSQVSFFLSSILSIVAALALTLSSERPLCGIVGIVVALFYSAAWFFRWQTIALIESKREIRDKEMKIASFTITSFMLILTLIARWPKQS